MPGLCLSVVALNDLFQTKTYFLSSLFLGLTAAAFPFILRTEWWALKGKGRYLPYTLLGVALVCGLSLVRGAASGGGVIDYWSLGVGELLYLFVAGALAIMAMVLPGISGSTLLLIFGVYAPTLYALRRLLALDLAVLPGLFALALGVLVGVGVSIRWIRAALRRNRAKMLYFILGLMAGSLYAIVMGPTTLSPPQQALHLETFHLGGFVLGVGILIGLERLKLLIARREARAEKTEDGTQGEEEAQSGGSPQGPA
ncbi:MAG: undecaprenyl phosphate translocase family protein [Evtepia gabavorous]